jgi:hypothetical protein
MVGFVKPCNIIFGIFNGHFVNVMFIWYIFEPFGIIYGHLVYLFIYLLSFGLFVYLPFGIWFIFFLLVCLPKKSGNPGTESHGNQRLPVV